MKVYKLRQGLSPVRAITKEQFEYDTKKSAPWYQKNQRGDYSQFAVCPACDNPIQIIALYKRRKDNRPCYGKHVKKSVPGISMYIQDRYDTCPYANPSMIRDKNTLRYETDAIGRQVLFFLREQFDRVVYILEQQTGIHIGLSLARNMLESFIGMKGHLYVGTNVCNLPWMFAYMTDAQSLFGKFIKNNEELSSKFKSDSHVFVNEKGQVLSSGGFVNINFCFINHKVSTKDNSINESIEFIVFVEDKEIYSKKLEVDTMYFHNLVNLPPERAYRNQKLLAIARELLPERQE